jgi:adenine-specific DNA-methyltransferase
MIMNEIFGEENGLTPLIWELPRGINAGNIARSHEYILVYAKNKDKLPNFNRLSSEQEYSVERCNKKIDERHPASELHVPAGIKYKGEDQTIAGKIGGSEKIKIKDKLVFRDGELKEPATLVAGWTIKDKFNKWLKEGEVQDLKGQKIVDFFFKENGRLYSKKKLDVLSLKSVLKDFGDAQEGRKDMERLFGTKDLIDYPKPVKLLKKLSKLITDDSDKILDFFTGSGTTHHAVMAQNAEDGGDRQCISVQLAEETDEDSEARKAGYEDIAEIARERIRRAGRQVIEEHENNEDFNADELDTGFKAFKLSQSNFKHWQAEEVEDEEALQQKLEDAIETKGEDAEELAMVFEIMLKLGIKLTAEIEEQDGFYRVEDTTICLSEDIDESLVESIIESEPHVAVLLEAGFDSDELKTNTALQMKDASIEFKIV